MYGYRLRALVWAVIALLATAYLTFFGDEPSWSENAMKALNSILTICLLGIADVFSQIANGHPEKERVFYKWVGMYVRLEHLARFTKYSFFGILIFSLNNLFPEWMHMAATGFGVTGLYLQMIRYWPTWTKGWWMYFILINLAALSLILAFGFHLFEVKYAEFALIAVGMIYLKELLIKK